MSTYQTIANGCTDIWPQKCEPGNPAKKTAPPAPTTLHQSKMSHTELLLSFSVFDSIALARFCIVCKVETNTPSMLELCC